MNELLFLFHVIVVLLFTFIALRIGKESLIAWMALLAVISNLFVVKQTELFALQVTCADVYAVGAFLTLNLIQEYYGKECATRTCIIALGAQVALLFLSQLHIMYIPSVYDATHEAFNLILTPYPRIVIASFAVFYFVQRFDILIFQRMRDKLPFASFAFRSTICLILSQLLDTILFSVFGLWGIVHSLWDVMLMSFLIKLIVIALTSPLTYLSRYIEPAR